MAQPGLPAVTRLRPAVMDPALVNTVGLHHSLATAVADLVDNSIDADAATVLVRFLMDGSKPVGLQVIDDGRGMDATVLDNAMVFAGTRAYSSSDLGHFGLGLKAASLSQADILIVLSRADRSTPAGRRMTRGQERNAPEVGDIDVSVVTGLLENVDAGFELQTGTIVEWRNVRTFPTSTDEDERTRWLELSITGVRDHLGIVLHRILAAGGLSVSIDVYDVMSRSAGPPRDVVPIDPFDYPNTGDPDFPQSLKVTLPDGSRPVSGVAHIWPARSQSPSFKLGGAPGGAHQGFFVYRRDRLLQAGGWLGIVGERAEWDLARVSIDLEAGGLEHVTINPEKSGLELSSDLARALERATCAVTGLTLKEYLDRAAGEDKRGRTRTRRPVTVTEPRFGLPPAVLASYRDSVEFDTDRGLIDIRWTTLAPDRVFEVEPELGYLSVNLRYRRALVGHRSTDPEDAPVLKVLFHLLLGRYFEGSFLGAKERAEIQAWQQILLAAVRSQQSNASQ